VKLISTLCRFVSVDCGSWSDIKTRYKAFFYNKTMSSDLVPINPGQLDRAGLERLPLAIARAGQKASWRFIEFFTADIRNKTCSQRAEN
jgi:hypothetical protein